MPGGRPSDGRLECRHAQRLGIALVRGGCGGVWVWLGILWRVGVERFGRGLGWGCMDEGGCRSEVDDLSVVEPTD